MGAVDTLKIEDGLALLPLIKFNPQDPAPISFMVTLDFYRLWEHPSASPGSKNVAGLGNLGYHTPRLPLVDLVQHSDSMLDHHWIRRFPEPVRCLDGRQVQYHLHTQSKKDQCVTKPIVFCSSRIRHHL